jgi:hypothetical protein
MSTLERWIVALFGFGFGFFIGCVVSALWWYSGG